MEKQEMRAVYARTLVEMAERDIVKAVEHRGIHVVRAAYRDIL